MCNLPYLGEFSFHNPLDKKKNDDAQKNVSSFDVLS